MLKFLEDHDVDFESTVKDGSRVLFLIGEPYPVVQSEDRLKSFVLLADGVPVVRAEAYEQFAYNPETDDRDIPILRIGSIATDSRHLRKGYSARMTEFMHKWASDRGLQLHSDWDLSASRRPFWQKQVAKGRAVMTNPDDPSETAYRLIAPPGTTLDGVWAPWSPPWGRR